MKRSAPNKARFSGAEGNAMTNPGANPGATLGGLSAADILPVDADRATLVGRVWDPAAGGPTPIFVRRGQAIDISRVAPTLSALFETEHVTATLQAAAGLPEIASIEALIANSDERHRDPMRPWLVAPCDLQ